ncbi:N-acyl-D-amino-acid deacylase family protein [Ferrimonas futtsuensis]|uniref:N-acyl-D-amino-acid deacylase family protein n=1 Tax=Ferrimonas futtsuensis TaxID=364764 RepID=UPI0003FF64B0|nr:amidohydrolase family protein [Ferrimonas futtsuensis]
MAEYDFLIRRGRYFDGSASPSFVADVAITGGRIARVSADPLPTESAARVFEAEGKWITPGFIDTHTHYDAELLVSPSLSESVRHGVTTALVGSCSLSMICSDYEDASDIFTRVETVPREKVLPILKDKKCWKTPTQWLAHIDTLPLGPNLISFLGHSDLRASVMGLERATDHSITPSEAEMQAMEALLEEALQAGFLGLSTMRLKWDKIDGDRAWSRSLPSTYAKWREIARLNQLVRRYGRVHQGAPNAATPLRIFDYVKESLGWRRKPLKTTLISQMDLKGSRYLTNLTKLTSRFTNLLRGDFRWQVLPTPFTVYADGIDVVFFEEFGAGEMALDLKDQVERNALLKDETYRREFRKFYGEKLSPRVWQRDLGDATIIDCPDTTLVGRNFQEVATDRGIHVVDLFLDLVVEYGTKLRWYTTVANHRPQVLKKLVSDPHAIISFSDAGAHIRNMAFYNLPLRMLKLVKQSIDEGQPVMTLEQAVWRLTGEQAQWLGVDAGSIKEGDRADLVILDPDELSQNLESVSWGEMENFDLQRLVNRNPGIVQQVFINGKLAVDGDVVQPDLGKTPGFGRFIPAGQARGERS